MRLLTKFAVSITLTLSLCNLGCNSSSTPVAARLDAPTVSQDIASGVGVVQKSSSSGKSGPVFVFEEVHTSRIGQLQIATMLLRLHDKYGVNKIGLEGGAWSGQPLDTKWYQNVDPSHAQSDKEDLAVRMVAQGEISSSELMAMLFPDVNVYGVEDATQYNQTADTKGNPEIEYLLAIAEKNLSPEDVAKVEKLIKRKKKDAAFEYILTANPWVKQQYELLKNSSSRVSAEELSDRLRGIQNKAQEVGAPVSPDAQQGMDSEIQFLQTASARSATMVRNTLLLSTDASGAPIAMIVGAAHADKVVALLDQDGASFALISPVDLDSKQGSMSAADYERKVNGQWASNKPGTLGYVLNSHRKPPPIIERTSGHSYASVTYAGILLARAAHSGGPFPDSVWPQISSLPDLRIDKQSIDRDGYDVIFSAYLKQDDGTEKQVWSRVGTRPPLSGQKSGSTLEDKLVGAADELKAEGGDGGNDNSGKHNATAHGGEPPSGKEEHAHSGDVERKGTTISRIGRDTLAVYGSKREDVTRVGQLSI